MSLPRVWAGSGPVGPSLVLALLIHTAGLSGEGIAAAAEPAPVAVPTMGSRAAATGPLRIHPRNPRYLVDGRGKAVLLTGSHTWNNLQDMEPADAAAPFDFNAYLDFLDRHHHNFIRLWRWELLSWNTEANREKEPRQLNCSPHPWRRSGPGQALDGKPRFDLTQFDPAYFDRLRSRVSAARDRGVYVSIMLFEGWGPQFVRDAWKAHPFHPGNSVQGIDVDRDGDGRALELHDLSVAAVTTWQEAYVRKVIDTVNDLDNVLFEISNENHPGSTAWQYHMIRFIRDQERTRARQHLVGMTFQYKGGRNADLLDSPADWISPNPDAADGFNYRDQPPAADGRKVILSDTDHLWGIGGNVAWVWKSVTRGLHPIFMDPYDDRVLARPPESRWAPVRAAQGVALRWAESVDLASMVPRAELASSGYCLASERDVLVYVPEGGSVRVDVSAWSGRYQVVWLNPATGVSQEGEDVPGGRPAEFTVPWPGDAVLKLARVEGR